MPGDDGRQALGVIDRDAARLARGAITAGVAVRLLYGIVLHPPLDYVTSDMAGYVQRAQRLARGGPIPRIDLFMPVGTQLLISVPMRIAGPGRAGLWLASVVWCALSCLFPWVAWRWASGVVSARAAAITAVACALSPLAIIYGGYFSSELPAMVLLPSVLWLGRCAVGDQRWGLRSAPIAGGLAVLLVVVRQQFVLNLVVLGLALVAARRGPRLLRPVVLAAAGAVLILALVVVLAAPPWRVVGGLGPVTGENGGLNFFYGHCDAHLVTTPQLFFESPVRAQRGTGTDFRFKDRRPTDQGYFYRRGVSCIEHSPVRAAVLSLRTLGDMTATSIPFPPWTEGGTVLSVAEVANVLFALLLVWLVAAVTLNRRGVPWEVVAHLACGFIVAVAFLGEPRYRLPYDIFAWALLGWYVDRRLRDRGAASV